MTFEDDFRSTLQHQAGDLDLHGRGATEVMHLARRRQHRARRAGAVAAVGVLGVGAIGVIGLRGRSDDGVSVASAGQDLGLPDVGPLELSWQTVPDGIVGGALGGAMFTEDTTGGIYAVSTAPGSRFDPVSGSAPPTVLYRLGADGSWAPVSGSSAPPLTDITAEGTVLYALSTSPSAGSLGYDAVLSSSIDGGATWSTASITPVSSPSTTVDWDAMSTLAIETVPGASVAVVTTTFFPSQATIDQAAAAAGASAGSSEGLSVNYTDAGLDVVRYGASSDASIVGEQERDGGAAGPDAGGANDPSGTVVPDPVGATPATTAPAADPIPLGKTLGDAPNAIVVATIPWAQLGISGAADLGSHSQVLVHQAAGWVPVEAPAFRGLGISSFEAVGQELVVSGWDNNVSGSGGPSSTRTLASTDGLTWREVPVSADSRLFGLGSAWVDVPWMNDDQQPIVRSSSDRGATWQSLDLGSVDERLAGTGVAAVDSGPLGLVLVVTRPSDAGPPTESYLVTTRDLANWSVTPLSDITGTTGFASSVFVGTDRIVVTSSEFADGDAVPPTVTAIGTPVR